MLRSYVQGTWHTASDEGRPLHDAVTGDEVARISTTGVDMAGVLEHGRRVGGPALRELTFHQRAGLLKALGGHLREHRDELYAISARTGATLYDAKFDVDGGIGDAARRREQGQARAAQRHRVRRGPRRAAGARRDVRRPAHLHSAARRGRAGQRVQLPGVGAVGEARARVPGGRAVGGQAGQPDGVPHRAAGRADRRIGAPARGHAAVRRRVGRRPVRPPHRTGPRLLHRLGRHRGHAAHPPGGRVAQRPVHRRGRLGQPLGARARRHARVTRVRSLRHEPRHGDDGQERTEVHRDPPRLRPRAARRRRRGGRVGPPGHDDGRQPDERGRADGRAGEPGAACGGPPRRRGPRRRRAHRVRRPGEGRRGRRGPRARRVHLADPAGRRPGPGRAARGGGVRTGLDRAALHVHGAGDRAGRTRVRAAWWARS